MKTKMKPKKNRRREITRKIIRYAVTAGEPEKYHALCVTDWDRKIVSDAVEQDLQCRCHPEDLTRLPDSLNLHNRYGRLAACAGEEVETYVHSVLVPEEKYVLHVVEPDTLRNKI